MNRRTLVMGGLRESGTVVTVAGLAGFYAAALVSTSGILDSMSTVEGGSVGALLGIASTVFIGIALYVSTIVMSGCVSTVIAGRLRQIAMLRLLGADARSLRRSVSRSCARAGLVGGAIGAVIGVVVADLTRVVLVARDTLPEADYNIVEPLVPLVILPVVGAAWIAGLIGSRKVLDVSPAQALSSTATLTTSKRTSRIRAGLAITAIVVGAALLGLSMRLGEEASATGFMVAFLGSAVSASGLLIGANFVVPAVVQAFSRLLGSDPTTRIARRNAVSDPMRTTRSTLGLIVGVALVTTFASGFSALRDSLGSWPDMTQKDIERADQVLSVTSTIMICIVVISCIMAAVGFISTMSLTVIQRRRELGLLRSLGFTSRQVRTMITKESVALGVTAVLFGIALGLVYGSVGAQSLTGSQTDGFVWGIPAPVLAIIAICAVALVLVAARPPARRAVRVSPVEALRVDA